LPKLLKGGKKKNVVFTRGDKENVGENFSKVSGGEGGMPPLLLKHGRGVGFVGGIKKGKKNKRKL